MVLASDQGGRRIQVSSGPRSRRSRPAFVAPASKTTAWLTATSLRSVPVESGGKNAQDQSFWASAAATSTHGTLSTWGMSVLRRRDATRFDQAARLVRPGGLRSIRTRRRGKRSHTVARTKLVPPRKARREQLCPMRWRRRRPKSIDPGTRHRIPTLRSDRRHLKGCPVAVDRCASRTAIGQARIPICTRRRHPLANVMGALSALLGYRQSSR